MILGVLNCLWLMLHVHGFDCVCDSEVANLKILTLCVRHNRECRMQCYYSWVLTEVDCLGKLVLKQHFLFLIEINYSYIQRLTGFWGFGVLES